MQVDKSKRIIGRLKRAIKISKDNYDPEEYVNGLEDALKWAEEELVNEEKFYESE